MRKFYLFVAIVAVAMMVVGCKEKSQPQELSFSQLMEHSTPEQVEAYTTQGGTPFLDGGYTVFGEVEEGLDVVEAIQNVETSMGDRPKTDVVMNVTVLK